MQIPKSFFIFLISFFDNHFSKPKNRRPRIKSAIGNRQLAMFLMMSLLLPMTFYPVSAAEMEMNKRIAAGDYRDLPAMTTMILAVDKFITSLFSDEKKVITSVKEDASESYKNSPTSAELAARVRSIKLSTPKEITIQRGQNFTLSAMPLDVNGNAVHGQSVKWQSENEKILRVSEDGQATALEIGIVRLKTSAGRISETVKVKVVEKLSDSSGKTNVNASKAVKPILQSGGPDWESRFEARNMIGNPVGATEPSSPAPEATIPMKQRVGSGNFSFSIPLAALSGRAMDVACAMVYNSSLWHKSSDQYGTYYNYNIDGNVVSGFTLSYGRYETFTGGGTLTDPDGTRHRVSGGVTTDSTFIQVKANTVSGGYDVIYTDGTKGRFTQIQTSSNRYYPTKFTDRNGNYIEIAYVPNTDGKLSWIKDTMGRYIRFYYDNNGTGKLVAVTVPGFNGGADLQTVRFYYDSFAFGSETKFESPAIVTHPVMAFDVLRYIYFPGTRTGFRYDYSTSYGMIRKVTQLRNMAVSTETDLTQTGTVTSAGQHQEAATTLYNYPDTAPSGGLTDIPRYTTRTDDWAGKGALPSVTTYGFNETSTDYVSTIIAPDGSQTESYTIKNPRQWNDGLLRETIIRTTAPLGTILAKTKLNWVQGTSSRNHRVDWIETTNEVGQTRRTSFTYDSYNNPTVVKEHDFAPAGTAGTELRRTETTYETSEEYRARRLLHLPKVVKVIANSVVVSQTEYTYDNGTLDVRDYLTNRTDLIMYDSSYNPFVAPPSEQQCFWDYDPPHPPVQWCIPANLQKHGNLTSVKTYANAQALTGAETQTFSYDVAGNLLTASASCCNFKTWTYNKTYEYAFPVEEKQGNPVLHTTSASYDFNTGLLKTATDENNQTTTVTYDTASLRQTRVDRPDGGYTSYEYNDTLVANPDSSHLNSFIKTTTALDSTRTVSSWTYFDGRGATTRTFGALTSEGHVGVTDVEYDEMGRVKRTSNPYYASGASAAINPSGKWTSVSYDLLGRATTITLPDNTQIQSVYNGTTTTVTDQSGRQRRQLVDALGRVIRVDEPDAAGNLGDVSSPVQPTLYEYDALDNLTKVTQTSGSVTQVRLFKYDSLSRLTHERQVEAVATLNDAGVKVGSGGLWTGVFVYNSNGLLTEGYDARGVKTTFIYDSLYRVSQVSFTGETNNVTPTVTYTYDQASSGYFNNGRLTKVETASTSNAPTTSQVFDYDKMGRVSKQQQTIGANGTISAQTYTLEYSYNLAGQLVSEKYPSGRAVNITVDDAGRLSKVFGGGLTYLSNLSYAGHGGLLSMTYGNGATENFSYNDRIQLVQQSLEKNNSVIQRYDYAYGQIDLNTGTVDATKNKGQLARVDAFFGGSVSNPTKQWQQRYSYDSIGRLERAKEVRGDNSQLVWESKFSYDRFGNRYRKASENPNSLPFVTVEETDVDKSTNRISNNTTYDEAGNTTTDNKFRNRYYRYDANGRMVWTQPSPSGTESKAVYDALGQRVATQVNNQWRYVVYDIGGKMVAEYGQATTTTDKIRYIQLDRQGSTRAMMNNSASVLARFDYQPFGEEISAGVGMRTTTQGYGNSDSSRQRYALTERDEATGLDHTWWRKYENTAGRWTSPDPYNGSMSIDDPQNFNRFAYVENDPVNFIDPSGLVGELNDGINTALAAFQKPLCRKLFGKTNPTTLLNSLKSKITVDTKFPLRVELSSNRKVKKITYQQFTGNFSDILATTTGYVGAAFLSIVINQTGPFVTGMIKGTSILSFDVGDGLTLSQRRAITIIHELLHALNKIPDDLNNSAQSSRNSWLVRIFCFGDTIGKRNTIDTPKNPPLSNTIVYRTVLPFILRRDPFELFRLLDIPVVMDEGFVEVTEYSINSTE